jgi:hypothetical protein
MLDPGSPGESTPEVATWSSYEDPLVGFGFQYPSNWYINQPANAPDSILNYAVILSNQPGNISPQGRTDNETVRLTISYARDQISPLELWIATNWTGLGSEIVAANLSSLQGWSYSQPTVLSPGTYTIFWGTQDNQYYVVESYASTNGTDDVMLREILSTLYFLDD